MQIQTKTSRFFEAEDVVEEAKVTEDEAEEVYKNDQQTKLIRRFKGKEGSIKSDLLSCLERPQYR